MTDRPRYCLVCGADLPTLTRVTGRPRVYCSAACRKAHHRRKSRKTPFSPATFLPVPEAAAPAVADLATSYRADGPAAVAALIDGQRAIAPTERLVRVVIELRAIVYVLRRIAGELPGGLTPRAEALADDIVAALRRRLDDGVAP